MKRPQEQVPPETPSALEGLATRIGRIQHDLSSSLPAAVETNVDQARLGELIVISISQAMNDIETALSELSSLPIMIETARKDIINQAAAIEAMDKSNYRSILYTIAAEHHGFVTTALAQAAGVPSVEVRKIASRGGMTNVAHGLYRVDGIDGGDRAPYAEAVLRVGHDGHLAGESVLALHNLALVNPRQITVATARRVRRAIPDYIRIVRKQYDPADLTTYDGIPSTTVERAIRDSIGSIIPERLRDATLNASDEGLIRRSSTAPLIQEIEAAA